MFFKRIAFVLLLLSLCLQPMSIAEGDFGAMIKDGYAFVQAGTDPQAWIDGPVQEAAGSSMDNYIIDICHGPHGLDLSAYVQSASKAVQPGVLTNPVSRQRCALTLIACGAGDLVPAELADETIGKLGVMSYAFGLHLLNNGAISQAWTVDTLADELMRLQLPDGGWAVMGSFGDTDVTAMCLQALACCDMRPEIQDAIDRGLDFLSVHQLENGRFTGMSQENSESCAQVVLALASLGIDPDKDARFIKNGISALDAFLSFRLPSGGFAHLPGEAENSSATVQALQALTALSRMGIPYFNFSANPTNDAPVFDDTGSSLPVWKWIALGITGAFMLVGVLFSLTRKRGRLKHLILFVLIAAIAAGIVLCLNIESAENYYSAEPEPAGEPIGSAFLTIRCTTVAEEATALGISEDGIILSRTEFPIYAGDSAFDLLIRGARANSIQTEHEGGAGDMAYVNGIHYLYEYQHGDLSGWMYSINGETPSVGSGSYLLKDGDEIIWEYTTNLGEDLK